MESLLERYPQHRGEVVMTVVLHDRSRHHADDALRSSVDGLVGRVNGRFGRADYCPVHYIKRTLPHEQIVALYAAAGVGLV